MRNNNTVKCRTLLFLRRRVWYMHSQAARRSPDSRTYGDWLRPVSTSAVVQAWGCRCVPFHLS